MISGVLVLKCNTWLLLAGMSSEKVGNAESMTLPMKLFRTCDTP